MSNSDKREEFYNKLKEKLADTSTWPSEYLYKFIVPSSPKKIAEVENIFDNVYDNMKVAGPAFLTDFFNKKNNDSLIIKNKIITEKNKEHYKKYYGIHLCDNNWLKYE